MLNYYAGSIQSNLLNPTWLYLFIQRIDNQNNGNKTLKRLNIIYSLYSQVKTSQVKSVSQTVYGNNKTCLLLYNLNSFCLRFFIFLFLFFILQKTMNIFFPFLSSNSHAFNIKKNKKKNNKNKKKN